MLHFSIEEKANMIKFGLHASVLFILKARYCLNTEAVCMWHH